MMTNEPTNPSQMAVRPCGGCGATTEQQRCVGCLHDFGTKSSAWVRTIPAPTPAEQESVAWLNVALQAIQSMPGAGPFTEEGKSDDWRFRARLARKEALDAAQAHIQLAFKKAPKRAPIPTAPDDVAKVVSDLRSDISAHELTGNGGMKRVEAVSQAVAIIEAQAAEIDRLNEELEALRRAVECERNHKSAYDATPQDRGGMNGPKGKAYQLWMDARADVGAALTSAGNAAHADGA